MRDLLAIITLVIGAMFAVYLGFWVCFVGGIADLLTVIKSTDISILKLGIGILKIIFSGFIGWFTFVFACFLASLVEG